MPSSLAGLVGHQALELSSNRFDSDVAYLLKALDKYLSELQNARPLAAMQEQPVSTLPASPKRLSPLDQMMSSMSPAEVALLKQIKDPQQRELQAMQWYMQQQQMLQELGNFEETVAEMRRQGLKAEAEQMKPTTEHRQDS